MKNIKLDKSNKIQIHSNLLGCKYAYIQYMHSFFNLHITARTSHLHAQLMAIQNTDFRQAKSRLEKGKHEDANIYLNKEFLSNFNNLHDLEEAIRSRERSGDILLRIGDIKERFWIIIGQVKTVFEDKEVLKFIDKIMEAEWALGKLSEDILKPFEELEKDIGEKMNSINIDGNKYSEYPNEKRNSFVKDESKKLVDMNESALKDANAKIFVLNSEIDNLQNYLITSLEKPTKSRWRFWRGR